MRWGLIRRAGWHGCWTPKQPRNVSNGRPVLGIVCDPASVRLVDWTCLRRISDLSHRSQRVPSLVTLVLIGTMARLRDLVMLFVHLIATVARLLRPGGARAVVAESLLLKHQLLILNRSRTRAPNLRPIDRIIAGLCTGLMRPSRLLRSAIVLKPATIMAFHRALVKC